MNARSTLAAFALLAVFSFSILVPEARAQGFAGLGSNADGFAVPQAGVPLRFPEDHGAHPDYRIEWWYLTANLKGADGRDYGVQWTLFRSALAPAGTKDASAGEAWSDPQIWMGHAAVTSADRHLVAERLSRGGTGQAGVTLAPFSAAIDDWSFASRSSSSGDDPLDDVQLTASGKDFRYALTLTAQGPLVAQGQGGYSVKSAAGQASYYYSQPFYRVSGQLTLPEGEVAVTGQAWLDREWSSQPLSADQTGWDWFSLHFDTGEKMMGFRLRDGAAGYTSGTFIAADGTPTPLGPGDLTVTPLASQTVAGHEVPVEWRVEVPGRGITVTTMALNPESWMSTRFPYWEGPIRFTGTHSGRGYLEMTGYP